ncbi:MAG: phospholipase D family protein, partial [Curvibacter sp.]
MLHLLSLVLMLAALSACSSLPKPPPVAPTHAITGFEDTPLARITQRQLPDDGRSGFLLQPYGPNSFATRLALCRLATRSLDVQYYLLQSDHTGRTLMRALRDAAARGVRVRVLVDDLHTAGSDELLLGLAAHPNVTLRLFNPFPGGRGHLLTRFISSGLDIGRVDRRMHNKLFVA